MKIYKKILRIWITLASFIGFIAGWVFLSHTTTTNNTTSSGNSTISVPALQAIPMIDAGTANTNNVQIFTLNTSQQTFSPVFRTGGS